MAEKTLKKDIDDQPIVPANDPISKKTEDKTVVKPDKDVRPSSAAPVKQLGSKKVMPEKKSDKRTSARKNPAARRGDAATRKAKSSESIQQSIRDHFPVRRTTRMTKSQLENERDKLMKSRLICKEESGLKAVDIEGKGRGVVTTEFFNRGDLLCEYSGELITMEEAEQREGKYGKDTSIGCYMYYFQYKSKRLCVDATADNKRLGRLINHSKKAPNVTTRVIPIDDHPYLCLMAKRDIKVGEELQYDYGERNADIIGSHPWLTS